MGGEKERGKHNIQAIYIRQQVHFCFCETNTHSDKEMSEAVLNMLSTTLLPRMMPEDPIQSNWYYTSPGGPHLTYSVLRFL